jgi:ubiquinone/menaquinone biosynthesis C-methylase UbiE
VSIDQKIFDKKYYYDICLGSDVFKKSNGKQLDEQVKKKVEQLPVTKSMRVLELGCGRGDVALYLAKKAYSVDAIDYSVAGIKIAKSIQKKYPKKIQEKVKFYVMEATELQFNTNQFDLVVLIDLIDHLNNNEQKKTMQEISRVLKKDGILFIRTCTNNILLSYVYKYYIYPVNIFLTWLDKKIKHVQYESLPKDPRTKEQKIQHINESNYHKLLTLFNKHYFEGTITSEFGFLKEKKGPKTALYNFLISFYPFSQYYPLNILFTTSFVCTLKNRKSM